MRCQTRVRPVSHCAAAAMLLGPREPRSSPLAIELGPQPRDIHGSSFRILDNTPDATNQDHPVIAASRPRRNGTVHSVEPEVFACRDNFPHR